MGRINRARRRGVSKAHAQYLLRQLVRARIHAFFSFSLSYLTVVCIALSHSHHHTGLALTLSGKPQWGCGGLLSPWLYCCLFGRCTLWHCLYPPAPPEKRRMFMGGEEMERGV